MLRRTVKRRIRESAQRLGNPVLASVGLRIASGVAPHERHPTIDFPLEWQTTIRATAPYTKVPPERSGALIQAVEHIVANAIPGAIVECGVWKGGSCMAATLTLKSIGELRDLYLLDTFEGMTAPTEVDVNHEGRADVWDPENRGGRVDIEEVIAAMGSTGYPMNRVRMVKGSVEDTVPAQAPERIALLRLDTDYYESTLHELRYLFPRLSRGGVLIVDDYGHYLGARKAVDEYFSGQGVFLHRLDYTGRLVIRT